jgi:hypothetical protein
MTIRITKTAFTSIDYDEPDPFTYRAVIVTIRTYEGKKRPKEKKHKFATGNVVNDFINAHNFLVKQKNLHHSCFSSSVDHFIMDGDNYVWTEDENEQEYIIDRKKFTLIKGNILHLLVSLGNFDVKTIDEITRMGYYIVV